MAPFLILAPRLPVGIGGESGGQLGTTHIRALLNYGNA